MHSDIDFSPTSREFYFCHFWRFCTLQLLFFSCIHIALQICLTKLCYCLGYFQNYLQLPLAVSNLDPSDEVKNVGESEKPYTCIDLPDRGKIYWDGTTFPDATLSFEQKKAIKERTYLSIIDEFVLEESGVGSGGEESVLVRTEY